MQSFLFSQGSGKNETIRDFARVCGQPYYPFTCATMMDKIFITGVFRGLAMTGTFNWSSENLICVLVLAKGCSAAE